MDILNRDTYIEIIQEIRNTEKVSIDTYIDKRLIPIQKENMAFIKTLYKDIYYLLDGIDKPGDNDLMIKDGDFVFEQGDLKLIGYQTRLHDLMNWLQQQVVIEMKERNFQTFVEQMEDFENNFMKKLTYTPEYKAKLDSLKASIRDERENNYEIKNRSKFKRLLHIDLLELKPNFCGLGINFNEMIKRIKNK